MTVNSVLEAIRALPPTDRRAVAETILDELDQTQPESISQEEAILIEERVRAHEANPEAGKSFEDILARVRAKYGR